ncbi:MAG: DsrE family protein [Gammaproteobacteria bacterium]
MSFKNVVYLPMLAFAALLLFSGVSSADDFAGLKEAKVVWNVTTGSEKVFLDRMDLIQQTADSLRKRGIKPVFVVVIHGPAAKFVAKDLHGTKFAKDKLPKLAKAHSSLESLKRKGTHIEVCAIAMKRAKIKHDNVRPYAVIEDNVFENLIALQAKGYAYMPVH